MPLEWTDEGRAKFEQLVQTAVARSDLSPAQSEQLRQEAESALAAQTQAPITAQDVELAVQPVLSRWRFHAHTGRRRKGKFLSVLTALAVVVLPALVLLVELGSHMCARDFFDPIPTWWHVLLIAWVPVAGVLGLLWKNAPPEQLASRARGLAIGVALPVTFLYMVAFLPLLPLSLFALFMGIGILSLTPVLCGLAFLFLVFRLAGHAPPGDRRFLQGVGLGFAATVLLLAAVEWRSLSTSRWLDHAVNGTPEQRADAVVNLRRFGDDDALARAASGSPTMIGPLAAWGVSERFVMGGRTATDSESARKVWYLVHGTPFRGPLRSQVGMLGDDSLWEGWDADLGGESVGLVQSDLFLAASRIDGAVDAPAGLAYVEWTFEFANRSRFAQQEARCLLELPDEAVVSRVTLWVEGEEREAAFAPTARARGAYRVIAVQQRRDPLLVTHQGDDRVLVQCFPVPARGSMKIRVGITVPLEVGATGSELRLPRIAARNFQLAPELEHAVGIEARHALAAVGLAARTDHDGKVWVEGRLRPDAFEPTTTATRITASEHPAARIVRQTAEGAIVCTFSPPKPFDGPPPVLVVDASASLAPRAAELGTSIRSAFGNVPLTVFVALDAGFERREIAAGADPIADIDFLGGRDNVLALAAGFDVARERGADLVWIAGPQPVTFPTAELDRRLEGHGGAPRLLCVQPVPGENVLIARAPGQSYWECFDTSAGMQRAIERALGRGDVLVRGWEVAPSAPSGAHRGPEHLADLYAATRIESLARAGAQGLAQALELARSNHLVTAVSGAVVLETEAQLSANGLEATAADELPSVPEPETVLLALLVAITAGIAYVRSRRAVVA